MFDPEPVRDHALMRRLEDGVRHAVLAPSSCNSQPWLFAIHGDFVDVRADRARALAVVDPFDRELVIACGAALYNLRIALQASGVSVVVDVLPVSSDPDLLARVAVTGYCEPSVDVRALFEALPHRRTHRGAFDARRVSAERLAEFVRCARAEDAWLVPLEGVERERAEAYLAQAERLQDHDARVLRERAVWRLRAGSADDGAARVAGDNLSARAAADGSREPRAAPARPPHLALLVTRHEEPAAWIAAGQALEHVLLHATLHGVRASFHNEPLECSHLRPAVARLAGRPGFAQFLLGFGFAPDAAPSSRRSLGDVLSLETDAPASQVDVARASVRPRRR